MNPRVLATVIALPVAVLTGVVVFNLGTPGSSAPPATPNAQATTPVTVDAPPLDDRSAVVCRALIAKLPDRVRDAVRRPVTAGTEQNAAYGEPAKIVQCGHPAASFDSTDDVYLLDGVCWHAVQQTGGTEWTTVDRQVPVKVSIPGDPNGAAQWVIGFSATVAASVPSAKAPAGCTTAAS
ncbi:DUF3515 family protein [Hamadaea tsunoensis]|uniref:DUF3515 family protein n=1 Tax=Hamadaea tsunoensis TaxID=53368 RepID=UPI00146F96A9|nr:DUF3515 family protein [Hamadaea tsunoensis]